MKRFEYKIVEGTINIKYEGYTREIIVKELNILGMEGWEICGMTGDRTHSAEIYLKREVDAHEPIASV